ncbi:hypothetical protein [Mycobacteroides abscessus]|uniref:hypothetical protein n=1 Tax=Mycobacteroides abscessus TaxID=36809 RepID=UPI0019D055C7|nr:hypothetical protein [Mycobacteroides abscessus]MBN7481033.1 hypothetical protein [Mycobacteroides abscessus subsp. massiliense]
MNKTTYAAATLLTLTALSATGILVHGSTATQRENGQSVTSPRTVIMADPPEPCPFPYPAAICAPIPPAPLDVDAPEEPMDEVAAEYAAAWGEIEVKR